ncbi:MAG: PqqD family protein [Chloroflexota bacterium]|nr:MAG: PqqD family protein [Chloroflexota bacterium]
MKKYKPTEDALVKPLGEGATALNLATGEYYSMSETAARMWSLLVEGRSENEIVDDITSSYATSSEEAKSDLMRLVRELVERGLLIEDRP